MPDAYIRVDVQIPRERLQRFLQGIRELEQEAPDEIHMIMQVHDDNASMKEAEDMLRAITPGFPHTKTILKQ